MCCSSPSQFAPEFTKRFKAENTVGCGCGGLDNCNLPSKAREGSPLWEWEQLYGKIINLVTEERGADGRMHQVVVRTTCPVTSTRTQRKGCCSLRYKVSR